MVADLFVISGIKQSNSGYADWNATGGTTAGAAGADFGFKIDNVTSIFPTVTLWKRFAQAPAATAGGTQTYTVGDYQGPLKAYGAAGTTNMGDEQSLGRALIEWGIATNPFLQDEAIAGSSAVTHWNQTTVWAGIYTNAVTRGIAARAAAGIDPIACVHRQGETDTSTTSGNLAILADGTYLKSWYNRYFSDVGVPNNTPIIVLMVNSAQSGALSDVPAYRAAQLAWKAIDSRVILIDLDDIPLHADPHYDMGGQVSAGYRIAMVIAALKGITSIQQAPGIVPTYRYDEACFSATFNSGTSSPVASQPRSGPDPQIGDFELLTCWSYSAVVTHVLATAAGFTLLGTQVDSAFSGTIHKAQTVYYRVLNASHFYTDGSGRQRTLTPAITFGTATLNIGKITTYDGVDPTNPINAFAFGTQTTSTTSATIPGLTATKSGCRVVIGGSHNGTNNSVTVLTNASLTGLTTRRDGRVNPLSGQVGYFIADGVLAGTALSTTAVTFSAAAVATSFAIALNQLADITATGAVVGGSGRTSATAGVAISIAGAARGGHGTITGSVGVSITLTGSARGGQGSITATGVAGLVPPPTSLTPKVTASASGRSINFSPTLWQGESRLLTLAIIDPDTGQAPDLSSGKWKITTCEWRVKSTLGTLDPPLISKSLGAGAIVVQSGGVLGRIDIILAPIDTASLPPGSYTHDVTATFSDGTRLYLIKPSALNVLGVVNPL